MAIEGNFLSLTTEQVDPNASGWAPLLNCTLSHATGGRNGPGLLIIRSAGAGEMRARTASSYPVTAGETYYTFADAASGITGAVPERIGIRWLDGEGTELGITWSLLTESAENYWHRISVAGAAPEAVASAQVVVSATPAAAGVDTYIENVYLGRPLRTVGNLLSFNAESGGELDLTAWEAEANTTIGRVVPPYSWSETWYYAGGHVVAATATAAGDCAAACVERAPVTPGVDYWGYLYLGPPTATADTWVELRYHDATDAVIATHRATLDQASTGNFRQYVSAIAPTGAVTASLAAGMTGATAGQRLTVEGAVLGIADPVLTGSVIPFADASFEQGPAGWTITSGPATIGRSSPWGAHAINGSYSLRLDSAAGTSILASARFPVTELENWRTRLNVIPDAGVWTIDSALRWYNETGAEISVSGNTGASTIPDTNSWWYFSADLDAPAGAVQARCEWTLTAAGAGSILYADKAALAQVMPASSTANHDDTGSITITFRELDVGELMTVWRVGADNARTLVRGPHGLYDRIPVPAEQLVIEDYEAPLGVPVEYYAEFHYASTGGQAGNRDAGPSTIHPGDANEAWLKDPGNPQRNMRILVAAAPDWTRPVSAAEHRVRGRRNAVVLSDVRGGLEGELAVFTRSDEERRRLHWLLDDGSVLLWQATPGMGVEDMYVHVGEVAEARIGVPADEPWRAWTLPLKQADTPRAVGVNGSAGRTWNDIRVEHGTWGDVLAAYATWEDVFLGRRKEA